MGTHAKLSPSSSKRWMTCPGSVAFIERANIKEQPKRYTEEGSAAHYIGEQCLINNTEPESFRGKTLKFGGFDFKVDTDMISAVEEYVEDIRNRIRVSNSPMELMVEVKCDLTVLGVDGLDGGTSDAVLVAKEQRYMIVDDYKHGKGVVVEPEGNTQAYQYAVGALIKLGVTVYDDPWDVDIIITQPRAFHPDGGIRVHRITSHELFEWVEWELLPAAKATHEPDAPLVPDDEGCRFCPVMGQCKAIHDKVQEVAHLDFEDIDNDMPDIESLTPDQKRNIMKYADVIKSFIVAVENSMKLDMDHGSKDYGDTHKLVRKQTKRRFLPIAFDEICSPIFDYLTFEETYSIKHHGLGVIETLLKKKAGHDAMAKIMAEITTKPEGDLVVAPLSDKRMAVDASITSDFEGLED